MLMFHLISYGEFMSVFSKTVAERTKPGQRQDIEEKCTCRSLRSARERALLLMASL